MWWQLQFAERVDSAVEKYRVQAASVEDAIIQIREAYPDGGEFISVTCLED